jgi:hypothetical protein
MRVESVKLSQSMDQLRALVEPSRKMARARCHGWQRVECFIAKYDRTITVCLSIAALIIDALR